MVAIMIHRALAPSSTIIIIIDRVTAASLSGREYLGARSCVYVSSQIRCRIWLLGWFQYKKTLHYVMLTIPILGFTTEFFITPHFAYCCTLRKSCSIKVFFGSLPNFTQMRRGFRHPLYVGIKTSKASLSDIP